MLHTLCLMRYVPCAARYALPFFGLLFRYPGFRYTLNSLTILI